jgi:hypothetical protein
MAKKCWNTKVRPFLHRVHRAEEKGTNNCYRDLTNKEKLV